MDEPLNGIKDLVWQIKIVREEAPLKENVIDELIFEVRILFDAYPELLGPMAHDSLKAQTRVFRAGGKIPIDYHIHRYMSLENVSLADLLKGDRNKHKLSKELVGAVLEDPFLKSFNIICAYHQHIVSNQSTYLSSVKHTHEEADTLIPLHVIDSTRQVSAVEVKVYSPDTDVYVLLIDVVANGRIGALTRLLLVTGKKLKKRTIDIVDCVRAMGFERAKVKKTNSV